MMFIITSFTALYSCSDDDNKNMSIITQTVDIPDFYTDNVSTAVEKTLSYIDEYNNENDLLTKANVTKFVSEIDECPAEITQTVEFNSSIVTQELTTYCRIATFYADDYIPSPDYLSRHYTRTLNVARQEILSTVVRKYSDGEWSDWTYHTNYYCASPTHGKNIAFFGGSFAHNIIDGKKGENRYGFQGYVEAFIKIAKYYNLPLLDIYNLQIFTEDNYTSYYLSDKIHPNGEGYRVISPYIINLLNK